MSMVQDTSRRELKFELMKSKKIDVLFLQETHSEALNGVDWVKEFNGLVI